LSLDRAVSGSGRQGNLFSGKEEKYETTHSSYTCLNVSLTAKKGGVKPSTPLNWESYGVTKEAGKSNKQMRNLNN
jgi:hypothetical protein